MAAKNLSRVIQFCLHFVVFITYCWRHMPSALPLAELYAAFLSVFMAFYRGISMFRRPPTLRCLPFTDMVIEILFKEYI
jgi:hypothetical protein